MTAAGSDSGSVDEAASCDAASCDAAPFGVNGARGWKAKAAFAVAVGVPLGVVAVADSAAAENLGGDGFGASTTVVDPASWDAGFSFVEAEADERSDYVSLGDPKGQVLDELGVEAGEPFEVGARSAEIGLWADPVLRALEPELGTHDETVAPDLSLDLDEVFNIEAVGGLPAVKTGSFDVAAEPPEVPTAVEVEASKPSYAELAAAETDSSIPVSIAGLNGVNLEGLSVDVASGPELAGAARHEDSTLDAYHPGDEPDALGQRAAAEPDTGAATSGGSGPVEMAASGAAAAGALTLATNPSSFGHLPGPPNSLPTAKTGPLGLAQQAANTPKPATIGSRLAAAGSKLTSAASKLAPATRVLGGTAGLGYTLGQAITYGVVSYREATSEPKPQVVISQLPEGVILWNPSLSAIIEPPNTDQLPDGLTTPGHNPDGFELPDTFAIPLDATPPTVIPDTPVSPDAPSVSVRQAEDEPGIAVGDPDTKPTAPDTNVEVNPVEVPADVQWGFQATPEQDKPLGTGPRVPAATPVVDPRQGIPGLEPSFDPTVPTGIPHHIPADEPVVVPMNPARPEAPFPGVGGQPPEVKSSNEEGEEPDAADRDTNHSSDNDPASTTVDSDAANTPSAESTDANEPGEDVLAGSDRLQRARDLSQILGVTAEQARLAARTAEPDQSQRASDVALMLEFAANEARARLQATEVKTGISSNPQDETPQASAAPGREPQSLAPNATASNPATDYRGIPGIHPDQSPAYPGSATPAIDPSQDAPAPTAQPVSTPEQPPTATSSSEDEREEPAGDDDSANEDSVDEAGEMPNVESAAEIAKARADLRSAEATIDDVAAAYDAAMLQTDNIELQEQLGKVLDDAQLALEEAEARLRDLNSATGDTTNVDAAQASVVDASAVETATDGILPEVDESAQSDSLSKDLDPVARLQAIVDDWSAKLVIRKDAMDQAELAHANSRANMPKDGRQRLRTAKRQTRNGFRSAQAAFAEAIQDLERERTAASALKDNEGQEVQDRWPLMAKLAPTESYSQRLSEAERDLAESRRRWAAAREAVPPLGGDEDERSLAVALRGRAERRVKLAEEKVAQLIATESTIAIAAKVSQASDEANTIDPAAFEQDSATKDSAAKDPAKPVDVDDAVAVRLAAVEAEIEYLEAAVVEALRRHNVAKIATTEVTALPETQQDALRAERSKAWREYVNLRDQWLAATDALDNLRSANNRPASISNDDRRAVEAVAPSSSGPNDADPNGNSNGMPPEVTSRIGQDSGSGAYGFVGTTPVSAGSAGGGAQVLTQGVARGILNLPTPAEQVPEIRIGIGPEPDLQGVPDPYRYVFPSAEPSQDAVGELPERLDQTESQDLAFGQPPTVTNSHGEEGSQGDQNGTGQEGENIGDSVPEAESVKTPEQIATLLLRLNAAARAAAKANQPFGAAYVKDFSASGDETEMLEGLRSKYLEALYVTLADDPAGTADSRWPPVGESAPNRETVIDQGRRRLAVVDYAAGELVALERAQQVADASIFGNYLV